MSSLLRIATRESPLALWQANYVKSALERAHPDLEVLLVPMTTRGDQILNSPLSKIGGKGLFIKELEVALLEDRADIAVHSMKDVPTELPEGMTLAAMLSRADPRDAFVSVKHSNFDALPHGARVGTSSLRRQCQLRSLRPDLEVLPLRGNVETRLRKLQDGDFDAIVLATAGLTRLGLADRITHFIDTERSLPAVGQGIVGVECRSDDARSIALLEALDDAAARQCCEAERAFALRLQGSCQSPIAGFAELHGEQIRLRGLVGSDDGRTVYRGSIEGPASQRHELGTALAERLIAQGAGALLDELRSRSPS